MVNKISFITILLLSLLIYSCDNKPKVLDDIQLPPMAKGNVFIANEGNFNAGNASLTVLDLANDKLYQNVFEKANARKLGDVFQSINLINGKMYFVVNNSQKIEVVDPLSNKSIATISGFTSPRYIIDVGNNKAYVSEYYANNIKIVDLVSNTITGTISINGLLDEMVVYQNKLFVTNAQKEYVYVVDVLTNLVSDSIKTIYGSNSMRLDVNNKLWVLCSGNATIGINPALLRINPIADSVEQKFSITFAEADANRLNMNAEGNKLYWLSKHVYSMGIADEQLSGTPFIRSINQNFYGLGINNATNELYVSDAKDYVQLSVINRYRSDGTVIGNFNAGVIAGNFYFYNQ